MENKQFPQEQEPVIEELTFAQEAEAPEESIQELFPETPAAQEDTPQQEESIESEIPALPEEPVEKPLEEENLHIPEDAVNETDVLFPGESENKEDIPSTEISLPEEVAAVPEILPEAASEVSADVILAEELLALPLDDLAAPLSEEPDPLDKSFQAEDTEFEKLLQETPQEPKKPSPPRVANKGRPKRKKGEGLLGIPNILATVVWLALIVVIGITAGRMLWVCAADVLAFGREDKAVTVTIYEADTMDDIIDKLHSAGLIRYKSLFSLYAGISDAEEDIKPGIYDLNTRYDYHALVNFMSPRSSREVIQLTIPEGYSCRQIFALLEENRICTAVDLASYAANGDVGDYWFLENVERGAENSLEGFLFPDTYEFYKNSTPAEAIGKMLSNFESRFTEEMRAQIDVLNANITGNYGVREIVIVASLIEKESAAPAESPAIAGVIYNRLFNWEYPALLNIDAAIIYAQGGDAENINTSLDSPYNTYLNTGLTPTPIANPGLSSIQAALNPESHSFYYYVLNPSSGMHQFSTTQAEHDAWIAQFYPN